MQERKYLPFPFSMAAAVKIQPESAHACGSEVVLPLGQAVKVKANGIKAA